MVNLHFQISNQTHWWSLMFVDMIWCFLFRKPHWWCLSGCTNGECEQQSAEILVAGSFSPSHHLQWSSEQEPKASQPHSDATCKKCKCASNRWGHSMHLLKNAYDIMAYTDMKDSYYGYSDTGIGYVGLWPQYPATGSNRQATSTSWKFMTPCRNTVKMPLLCFPIGPSDLLVPFLNPFSDLSIVAGSGNVIVVAGTWDGGRVDGDGLRWVHGMRISNLLWNQRALSQVDVTYSAGISQKFALATLQQGGRGTRFFTRKSDVQLFEKKKLLLMLLDMFWSLSVSWAAEEGSSCSPEIKSVYVSRLRFSCCAKKERPKKSLQQGFCTLYWTFMNHWSHQKWKSNVLWCSSFQLFLQVVQSHFILGRRSFRRHCVGIETVKAKTLGEFYVYDPGWGVVTLSSQTTATALELAELQIYANGFILQNLSAATAPWMWRVIRAGSSVTF